MNSCNKIRIFLNLSLIFFAPLNPLVVLIDCLHSFTFCLYGIYMDFSQLLNLIISISLDVCNDAFDGFSLE
jgi:hypothetical protein